MEPLQPSSPTVNPHLSTSASAKSDREAIIKTGLTIENMTNNISFYGEKDENMDAQGSKNLENRVTALTDLYTQKKGIWAKFINILRRIFNFLKTFVPFAALSVEAKTKKALVHTNLVTTVVANFTQDKLSDGSLFIYYKKLLNKQLAKEYVKATIALAKVNPNATDSATQKEKIEDAFKEKVKIIADSTINSLIKEQKAFKKKIALYKKLERKLKNRIKITEAKNRSKL